VGSLFFAGLLSVSSSAVIGKIISDGGIGHRKSSQLALGMTLGEDIVAIVMITLLGSYARFGVGAGADVDVERAPLLPAVALFGGFVLAVATLGLLIVPRVLRRLDRQANAEVETIFVAGLLFGLALMVVRAGYSVALGAFLLGAIIAETPQRARVERGFAGMRDLFGAIFFVAMGMTIDLGHLRDALVPLGIATALALVGRPLAASFSLLALGYDGRTAVRTGLLIAPLGEFSFILAQMGTDPRVHLLPPEFMSVAVGAALITAFVTPILVRHDQAIADVLTRRRVPLLGRVLRWHRNILDALQRQRRASILWKLTRKRLVQIGVEVAIVSAALAFARPLIERIVAATRPEVLPDLPTAVVCWAVLGIVLLAPLVAVWRNTQALALILANAIARQGPAFARLQPVVTTLLQGVAFLALVLWLWNFVPAEGGLWFTGGVLLFLAIATAVLWRRLIYWHSTIEISLGASLSDEESFGGRTYDWIDRYAPWGLQLDEVALPDRFALAGRSIGDVGIRSHFGCSVIGIERLSFTMANPGPASHLFPGDRLLLLGTKQQIAAARDFLLADQPGGDAGETFRDLTLEMVDVPQDSPAAGHSLMELNWSRLHGVQIVGHENRAARTLTPPADLRIAIGDRLLVLGTPSEVLALRQALQPPADDSAAGEKA
jgi:CPA2 family monovalent cation:H+ antiporter-2